VGVLGGGFVAIICEACRLMRSAEYSSKPVNACFILRWQSRIGEAKILAIALLRLPPYCLSHLCQFA
jgi:hypothetical protein